MEIEVQEMKNLGILGFLWQLILLEIQSSLKLVLIIPVQVVIGSGMVNHDREKSCGRYSRVLGHLGCLL